MHLRDFFQTIHWAVLKHFHQSNRIWKVNGRWHFQKILPIKVPKCHRRKVYVFCYETFKLVKVLVPETWFLPFPYGYCWSDEDSHSRKTHSESYILVIVYRTTQNWELRCKWRIWSWILYSGPGKQLRKQCWKWIWSDVVRKRILQTTICLQYCQITFSHDVHGCFWV